MQFSWSKEYVRRYSRLPKKIQQQVEARTLAFAMNEFDSILNNHKLSGEYAGKRSINITGNYRAIYQKLENGMVHWVAIGTHSQLYE
mgnify:CR=1 FL=1